MVENNLNPELENFLELDDIYYYLDDEDEGPWSDNSDCSGYVSSDYDSDLSDSSSEYEEVHQALADEYN